MADGSKESLDLVALAKELGTTAQTLRLDLDELESTGLCLHGLDGPDRPILLHAGRQYLARRGAIEEDVLRFLPQVIDDLDARQALIAAGTIVVDEFRTALRSGHAIDHARWLVPPAFAEAVDEELALELYAASVALIARLSAGAPAGCVAEEIVAVSLIEKATAWLELRGEAGELDAAEIGQATSELRGFFELFEDDDVLNLFEMEEPADASLARHDPVNQHMGVADQRIEAWFDPFSWTTATGYLNERG